MSIRRALPLPLVLSGLLAGAALAGCGADSSGSAGNGSGSSSGIASASSSATGAAETVASPGVVPSGYPSAAASTAPDASLTIPGTSLALGSSATVAWQPSQHTVGVLDLTVTALHKTSFKESFTGWELDAATKATAPYFVEATVRNAGSTDLSGQRVPLYGSAASGALVEASTFATDFKPCGPSVLPTPFPAGASADVCLVYLVPQAGALDGVTFRPTESFTPITWTGAVTPLAPSPSVTPSGKASGKASGEARATASPK